MIFKIFLSILNILFPKKCLSCLEYLNNDDFFCDDCNSDITYLKQNYCLECGEYANNSNQLCGKHVLINHHFERSYSLFAYNPKISRIIHDIKYNDKPYLINYCGIMMLKLFAEIIKEHDIIIPVPIHYFRLIKRQYNHVAILARFLSKKTNTPYDINILYKNKHIVSQTKLTNDERRTMANNVFKIHHIDRIKNKKILVLDDVITTGTTINTCIKLLLDNGARTVNVMSVSRAFA